MKQKTKNETVCLRCSEPSWRLAKRIVLDTDETLIELLDRLIQREAKAIARKKRSA